VHAFVQRRGRDSLLIVDVGSTNGTRVVDDGVEHMLERGRRACVVGLDARLYVGGWCHRVALKNSETWSIR
jgi:pSer/pThr/pTyr-binding forkhead associated (FHA) protein